MGGISTRSKWSVSSRNALRGSPFTSWTSWKLACDGLDSGRRQTTASAHSEGHDASFRSDATAQSKVTWSDRSDERGHVFVSVASRTIASFLRIDPPRSVTTCVL